MHARFAIWTAPRGAPGTRSRGLTLMEVLISMGVLAVGLMSIAAMIPAGRYQVAQGTRLEYAAMVGRGALREVQLRGLLNPGAANPIAPDGSYYAVNWVDGYTTNGTWLTGNNNAASYNSNGTGNPAWNGTSSTIGTLFTYRNDGVGTAVNTNQIAVAIDPLGITAPVGSYGARFPYRAPVGGSSTPSPPQPLARIVPFTPSANPRQVFDAIFRSSVDQITTANKANSALPPLQNYLYDNTGNQLRRSSEGSYSWLATVVSDPTMATATATNALSADVIVSVAVFYKRDLSRPGAGEYIGQLGATPTIGELLITNVTSNASQPIKDVQPGQWLMLAGTIASGPIYESYYRWYQVVSAGPRNSTGQRVTVRGPDWTVVPNFPAPTSVWIFDNIVGVYEKTMKLEMGK